MPGTVKIVDSELLLFCFPYDPDVNRALRRAADNRVHWDAERRGFTLSASRLRHDPSMIAEITGFIRKHGLDADADVGGLLGFREVNPAIPSAAPRPQQRPPSPGDLGPGQLRAGLLPSSTWGSNLRGVFSREDWDALRIPVCTAAGNVCEVCGAETYMDNGRKRRPDCHELWVFEHEDGRNIQRLGRLIALCPDCHRVQHVGLAELNGETGPVIAKLREVNHWTERQAELELDRAWAEYERRERYRWDLDLAVLSESVTIDGFPDLYIPAAERDRLGNSYYG